ncbi:MAG: hypothetical protein LC104_18300 [Bacteroidales bacterium]|nr:hypothetical protein [Bacteroidales bacterium]
MPGVLLILIGVFPLGIGILNTLHWASGGMTEQVEEMVKQNNAAIDANPKIAPADRQQQKDLFADIMRVVLEYMPVMLTINLLGNLLVVLGGINMLRVSGHGLAILGSVVAMVPFITSCCCFVGIPIGIWAIVLLTSKDVKAAFYPPTQLLEDQW